ncbi:MAG TPA: response regulator transcription factor [Candidatus Limnocylindrales bacterium]|nr:response regulator transcription factor [Candidatus Limnocylindrales bacterium]
MRTNGAGAPGRIGVAIAIFEFPMLSAGYRAIIDAEPDLHVVGEVPDREALDATLAALRPDVLIAECPPLSSPGSNAFGTIEACRAGFPGTRILGLETRGGSEQFSLALKAGADGFLSRESEPVDITNAVRSVCRGQTYVSPAIVTRMVNTYVLRSPEAPLEDAYAALTDREKEVLLLAAVGHTNREIAKIFHLSEQTVHNYRANIMEKLGFHDRLELLKFAIRRGIVSVADL